MFIVNNNIELQTNFSPKKLKLPLAAYEAKPRMKHTLVCINILLFNLKNFHKVFF